MNRCKASALIANSKRRWSWIVGVLVVLFFILLPLGNLVSRTERLTVAIGTSNTWSFKCPRGDRCDILLACSEQLMATASRTNVSFRITVLSNRVRLFSKEISSHSWHTNNWLTRHERSCVVLTDRERYANGALDGLVQAGREYSVVVEGADAFTRNCELWLHWVGHPVLVSKVCPPLRGQK